MSSIKSWIVGAAVMAISGAMGVNAQAASDFDLDFSHSNRGSSTSLSYVSGDITATVSSEYYSGGRWRTAQVQQWAGHGLGVLTPSDSSHQVDGQGKETVWISLSEVVNFTLATFSYTGNRHDQVTVLDADGNVLSNFSLSNNRRYADTQANTHVIDLSTLNYAGTVIGFQANHHVKPSGRSKNKKEELSAWKLVGLSGDLPPTQTVPTPAAAGLGLLGLIGLSMRRRSA